MTLYNTEVRFGFSQTSVNVAEGDDIAILSIGMSGGGIQNPFDVRVFTSPESAEGINYIMLTTRLSTMSKLPKLILFWCYCLTITFVSELVDYTAIDVVYTFTSPNEQMRIEVLIVNDSVLEEKEETFLVEFVLLTDSESVPVTATEFQAKVTINDDDCKLMHIKLCFLSSLSTYKILHATTFTNSFMFTVVVVGFEATEIQIEVLINQVIIEVSVLEGRSVKEFVVGVRTIEEIATGII